MRSLLMLLAVSLLPAGLLPGAAGAAEQAGVSAAVRGDVALARERAVDRQVDSGEEILMEDWIRSGPRSGMQILLMDETTFTVGPESEVVVDEFVYDPATGSGKLSARVAKGVLRFVSGRMKKSGPEDVRIQLPAGTIGIRGTILAISANAVTKASLSVLLGEGKDADVGDPDGMRVCNVGECVDVTRAGYGTEIAGPDAPPRQPFRVDPGRIDEILRSVSDPEGTVEQAAAGGPLPDVAAGPGGGPGGAGDLVDAVRDQDRTRADGVRSELGSLDQLDRATDIAAQDEVRDQEPQDVLADVPDVPGIGDQVGFYSESEIPFDAGGSYNFELEVDLAAREARFDVSDISIPSADVFSQKGFRGTVSGSDLGSSASLPATRLEDTQRTLFGSAEAFAESGNLRDLPDQIQQSVSITDVEGGVVAETLGGSAPVPKVPKD